MTVRTVIESLAGTVFSISASLPASYDSTGYTGSNMFYTDVGEIETHGDHGVEAQVIKFTPVDTAVVAKLKGSKDYGNMPLTIGAKPGDAGQVILESASESQNRYSAKITYPDTTVHYMDVLITKYQDMGGGANDVHKISVQIEICRRPVKVLQS